MADVRAAVQIQDLRTLRDKAGIPYAVVSHDISIGMISDVSSGAASSAFQKISDDRIRGFDDYMKARVWLLADDAAT